MNYQKVSYFSFFLLGVTSFLVAASLMGMTRVSSESRLDVLQALQQNAVGGPGVVAASTGDSGNLYSSPNPGTLTVVNLGDCALKFFSNGNLLTELSPGESQAVYFSGSDIVVNLSWEAVDSDGGGDNSGGALGVGDVGGNDGGHGPGVGSGNVFPEGGTDCSFAWVVR